MTEPAAQQVGDDRESIDQPAAEAELAKAKRKKKRLSLEAIVVPPNTRHYALAPTLLAPVKAIFTGDGITSGSGDFDRVMHLATQIHNLAVTLGAHLNLVQIFFGNSVTVEFRPLVPAAVLEEAERLSRDDPEGEITVDEIERLMPPSVVGAAAAARILRAPPAEALEQASRYGADTRDALLALSEAIAESDGSMRLEAPGDREAVIDAGDAEEVLLSAAPAAAEEKLRPRTMRVVGTLSRIEAGDDRREPEFSLRLDPKLKPKDFAPTRRYVEGRYTSSALSDVNREGLVDQLVIASVRAWPVRVPRRKRLRFDRFVFERLEPYAEGPAG
jgi:hypothetical protein